MFLIYDNAAKMSSSHVEHNVFLFFFHHNVVRLAVVVVSEARSTETGLCLIHPPALELSVSDQILATAAKH